jgi:hypothetical protein
MSVRAAGLQAHHHRCEQPQRWQGREVDMHITLTELVQRAVEALGQQVLGIYSQGCRRHESEFSFPLLKMDAV